ncbi:hypothetical protein [Limnoglobus roseus]|uniref:Lipoprotein n=1 Tax=Limnoglobus roseus TaxID=2598579 RepID=A0A5C1ANU3_9BACT|nr:hypothetical protein [Limnoglobus roseus]QEL19803.1 hypothetical protein PX52LOC_06882 [Limnoglobus roseus]
MSFIRRKLGLLALSVLPLTTGCAAFGPGLVGLITVQPWMAERMTDKYQHTNDTRTPVLGPIRDGNPPPLCEDPPSDPEILRAMPRVARGVPFVYEEFRQDVQLVKNRLVDTIDPPRFFPLVGMAQLHHCHWECVVYYKETVQSAYPFPTYVVKPRTQVIYIDKDHLHLYVGPNPDMQRKIGNEMNKY